jgi:hypothetical protein
VTHPDADASTPAGAVRLLRSTATVRARAHQLLARARAGASDCFAVNDEALVDAARTVARLTRERYPAGHIPYHSRWRHFEAGGVDRVAWLNHELGSADAQARARTHIDLVLVSVLLDAGAGANWSYQEAASGQRYTRSEGLGVASFQAFAAGLFSSDPLQPLRADATALQSITAAQLGQAFQVSPDNPLVGLDSRAALLRRLGQVLAALPATFGPLGRPGGLFDARRRAGDSESVSAHDILVLLLETLSAIWPAGNTIGNEPLGDCWPHHAVTGEGLSAGWMPFHKLSQWLSYSLLEPFQWAGVRVTGLDALTGLPEYRNGGLLLDAGVLQALPAGWAHTAWQVGSPFIVEWRALTVALLDELAPLVRSELGLSADEMPLACVLEGGTWAAGRLLAQRARGGLPPLNIVSDGTVF